MRLILQNSYGNLPELPSGYVKRNLLETELTALAARRESSNYYAAWRRGMGKTSLALAVAHGLATIAEPPFEHVVWFSARDVDLRPTGPSEVRPSVVDLQSVSKRFGRLFSDWGGGERCGGPRQGPFKHHPAFHQKESSLFLTTLKRSLMCEGLHKFLDEHTHLPNKL